MTEGPESMRRELRLEYSRPPGEMAPFFEGLGRGVLLGTRCAECAARFATPRFVCDRCGGKTKWFALPEAGRIHSYTVCHFSSARYLDETPFALVLVEFEGVDTLLMGRLDGCPFDRLRIGLAVRPAFPGTATDVRFIPL